MDGWVGGERTDGRMEEQTHGRMSNTSVLSLPTMASGQSLSLPQAPSRPATGSDAVASHPPVEAL